MEWKEQFLQMLGEPDTSKLNIDGAQMFKIRHMPKVLYKFRSPTDESLDNLAPNLGQFLTRSINMGWYFRVEESEPNAQPGDRFLVHRYVSTIRNQIIVQDFITTRCTDQNNIYQGWSHQTVAYLQGDNSPYPFHFDRR